ncbi:MAG: P27 family phage terminase small subunit, partial [Actinobacteria bacterium]|nr:P27 family phage terminase small subunit [Actinomycetota bacterium]
YCVSWATYEAAAQDIAERGVIVPGRSSADEARGVLVKNPSVQVARDASASLLRWCRELGFTPDARGRIDVKELTGDRHLGPERFFSGLE